MLPLAHPRLWLAGAGLIAATIIIGSLLPSSMIPAVGVSDKLEHAGAYFLLTFWITGLLERRRYVLSLLLGILLGVGLEVAQSLLTVTRQADPLDVVANATGIALALTLAYLGLGGWARRVEAWFGAEKPG